MKLLRLIIALCALCLVAGAAAAAPVRLYGVAKQYAGYRIEVERYTDFISQSRSLLAVVEFDAEGRFDIEFDIPDVEYAFMDLGKYRAYIYLEPGVDYEIVMPPLQLRPESERFNPFYVPEPLELGIANETGSLNEAIRNYDAFFDANYHVKAIAMVRSRNVGIANKLMQQSDSVAAAQNCSHPYFAKYVRYRNAQIYASPRLRMVQRVASEYFNADSVLYNVPSYWDALRLTFDSFLPRYLRGRNGKAMASAIAANSFAAMADTLATDTAYSNRQFCEALVLKCIYDAYYTGQISYGATDTLLVSAVATAQSPSNVDMARNMLTKKNRLRTGTQAPSFNLFDINGDEVTLDKFRGRFVYLAFLHTDNYACRKDFVALSGLHKKYRRDVAVVGILTNEDATNLDKYFSRRTYPWTVLSFNAQQSVVLDYQVGSLPAYYLIDPEGRMALAPAPAPTEQVEKSFAEQMLRYKQEKLRRKPEKNKSIYDIVIYGR